MMMMMMMMISLLCLELQLFQGKQAALCYSTPLLLVWFVAILVTTFS
jgi:hypothetical protein